MQHEVTRRQPLLNDQGMITEPGWARKPLWQYDRRKITAPGVLVKEWDYYLVNNNRYAAAFTISDLGYAGMISVSLVDLILQTEHTETILTPFPMGGLGLRATSASGDAHFKNDRITLRFGTKPGRRYIHCEFKNFKDEKDLIADIAMWQPDMDSMCIATPWKEKATAFYYNQKINCMPANGVVVFDGKDYVFDQKDSMAVLDWGRGVWTYDNTWYWGTCSSRVDGKAFGFNLGYGFSDRSSASENVIFYAGKAHKLSEVTFHIPEDEEGKRKYTEAWTITSDDGRFEAIFMPILDRSALTDLKVIVSDQHQVFGHLTGTAVLDDGREIKMRDLVAAIEVVHNRY